MGYPNTDSRQSGQAAVLIALSLFSMVIFLAMATNTGILVNERIRIQNSADLAAYAGAHAQSVKLNNMSFLNKKIMEVATYCRCRLTMTTAPKSGLRTWNKVWNQCLPERKLPGAGDPCNEYKPDPLPVPPMLKARGPRHPLANYPPNPETPPDIPRLGPEWYGPTNDCTSEFDRRADDVINWCEKTMNYYGQIIYDLNQYDAAYYGNPEDPSKYSVVQRRPIVDAMRRTAQANYPLAKVEMIDQPASSPVYRGRFMQQMVTHSSDGGEEGGYVEQYERPGGPSMVPLRRYTMNFNYVFKCCSTRADDQCRPAKCGFAGNVIWRNVGAIYGGLRRAWRQVDTVFFMPDGGDNSGLLYLPVVATGEPARHNVPLLDINRRPNSSYFGGRWGTLSATAVAKPYDGFIGPTEDVLDGYDINVDEDTPMMPRKLNGLFVVEGLLSVQEDGYYGPNPQEANDTYRARVAGFHEPLKSSGSGSLLEPLVQQLGSEYGYTTH